MAERRLFEVALGSPWIPPIKRRLDAGDVLRLNSVADAAKPFVVSLLAQITNRPVLVVTDGLKSQEAFFNDLQTFQPDALFYPAWETLPHEEVLPHVDTIADRLKVLTALLNSQRSTLNAQLSTNTADCGNRARKGAPTIVASAQALMQRTFSASALSALHFPLALGQNLELDALVSALTERGYSPQYQVGERGDMAHRGGIVDFFPLDRDEPVRVEFAGDEIESIRTFDPVTQQSRDKLATVVVTPAGEPGLLKRAPDKTASLLDFLTPNALLVLDEPDRLAEAADSYARQIPDGDPFFEPWEKILASKLQQVYLAEAIAVESLVAQASLPAAEDDGPVNLRLPSLDAFRPLDSRTPEPEVAEQMRRAFFDQMRRWLDEGYSLHVLCSTDGEQQRFEELWRDQFKSLPSTLHALTLRALPRFPLARCQARGRHGCRNLRALQTRSPAPQVSPDGATGRLGGVAGGRFRRPRRSTGSGNISG